jgi:NodT family efflux transporter outer membrane factor (OMF) lipoprotein
VELPPRFVAAPAVDAPEPSADRWWESFGDPRLAELVTAAWARNPDLGAAAARVEAALAQARIAGSTLAPQLEAAGSGSRARQNFIGLPIPGGERQVLSSTSTSLGVSLNIAWEADLWGRLAAARSAARAQGEATRADLAAARLSLTGQVVKGWFAVTEAQAQVELAAETRANRALTEERIRRRFEAGLRGALDLRLARANRAAADALLAQRRQQLDAAVRQLETLLGSYPEGRRTAGGPFQDLPATPPVGLPAELLTRRPDLVAAELRLAAAGFSVAEARASLYPQLRLTGSAGRRSQELEDLLENDFSVWSLAANLLQPLFQGGRLRAGVDLQEARFREAALGYAGALLAALGEVETTLAAEELLRDQVSALAEAATQAEAARKLSVERYGAGLVDLLTVLESERQALDSRSQLLAARRQLLANRADLHLALGGGFRAGTGSAGPGGAAPPPVTAPSLETSVP